MANASGTKRRRRRRGWRARRAAPRARPYRRRVARVAPQRSTSATAARHRRRRRKHNLSASSASRRTSGCGRRSRTAWHLLRRPAVELPRVHDHMNTIYVSHNKQSAADWRRLAARWGQVLLEVDVALLHLLHFTIDYTDRFLYYTSQFIHASRPAPPCVTDSDARAGRPDVPR